MRRVLRAGRSCRDAAGPPTGQGGLRQARCRGMGEARAVRGEGQHQQLNRTTTTIKSDRDPVRRNLIGIPYAIRVLAFQLGTALRPRPQRMSLLVMRPLLGVRRLPHTYRGCEHGHPMCSKITCGKFLYKIPKSHCSIRILFAECRPQILKSER